jgi:hypothetical protein
MIPDEDLHRHAVENLDRADALLFGRVTYEMMETAWRPPARTGARPDWMEPFARTIIENGLTESAWVEKQIGRPVIKVPNSIVSNALAEAGRPAGSRDRVALPISGDNSKAKEIVAQIIDRFGFDTVDAGTIAESWRQQPGSPAYCTNPTKEELQKWLKNVDRSSLVTN